MGGTAYETATQSCFGRGRSLCRLTLWAALPATLRDAVATLPRVSADAGAARAVDLDLLMAAPNHR